MLRRDKGYYLPDESSKAVTEEYLINYAKETILTVKDKEVKKYPFPKDLKAARLELVEEIAKKKTDIPLGFSITNLLDRQWLIDILYTKKLKKTK